MTQTTIGLANRSASYATEPRIETQLSLFLRLHVELDPTSTCSLFELYNSYRDYALKDVRIPPLRKKAFLKALRSHYKDELRLERLRIESRGRVYMVGLCHKLETRGEANTNV